MLRYLGWLSEQSASSLLVIVEGITKHKDSATKFSLSMLRITYKHKIH